MTVEGEVQVVWKDFRLGNKGYYRVGVKFVHISVEDIEKLKSYLHTLINCKISNKSNGLSKLASNLGIIFAHSDAYLDPKSFGQD